MSAFRNLTEEAIKEQDTEKLEEPVAAIRVLLYVLDRRLASLDSGNKLSDAAHESLLRLQQKPGPWASKDAAAYELGLSRSEANLHLGR